jgi:hypothetical protein
MSGKPGASTDVEMRRARLRERPRAEWITRAEEEWQRRTGRPMTAEELAVCSGVIRQTCRRTDPQIEMTDRHPFLWDQAQTP